jgi:ABC-type microcin C transport system duplicated ATPase subunit YejF
MTSLSPLMTIGKQIEEAILLHRKCSRLEAAAEAVSILGKVGIPDPEVRAKQYPHEFSGGDEAAGRYCYFHCLPS